MMSNTYIKYTVYTQFRQESERQRYYVSIYSFTGGGENILPAMPGNKPSEIKTWPLPSGPETRG